MAGKQLVLSGSGYPGTLDTLKTLNTAILENALALAKLCGDKVIITGVTQNVLSHTSGWVAFNGEILPFQGGVTGLTVSIYETPETAEYDGDLNNDGINDILPISKGRVVKFGSAGASPTPFNQFVRIKTIAELSQFALPDNIVIDANYVHTDNNLTQQMIEFWDSKISNVQANWNAIQGLGVILNKPTNLETVLKKGTLSIGDVIGNPELTISFASVGTTLYNVHIGFESITAASSLATATVWYTVHTKTQTSFKLRLRESGNITQNLKITYKLTPQ